MNHPDPPPLSVVIHSAASRILAETDGALMQHGINDVSPSSSVNVASRSTTPSESKADSDTGEVDVAGTCSPPRDCSAGSDGLNFDQLLEATAAHMDLHLNGGAGSHLANVAVLQRLAHPYASALLNSPHTHATSPPLTHISLVHPDGSPSRGAMAPPAPLGRHTFLAELDTSPPPPVQQRIPLTYSRIGSSLSLSPAAPPPAAIPAPPQHSLRTPGRATNLPTPPYRDARLPPAYDAAHPVRSPPPADSTPASPSPHQRWASGGMASAPLYRRVPISLRDVSPCGSAASRSRYVVSSVAPSADGAGTLTIPNSHRPQRGADLVRMGIAVAPQPIHGAASRSVSAQRVTFDQAADPGLSLSPPSYGAADRCRPEPRGKSPDVASLANRVSYSTLVRLQSKLASQSRQADSIYDKHL